jgi:hypothetical protein
MVEPDPCAGKEELIEDLELSGSQQFARPR